MPTTKKAASRASAKPKASKASTRTATRSPKATAMLEAHVAWWRTRLTDDAMLEAWMRLELDRILSDAAQLKLKEVVSAAQIKAVAKRYAVDLDLKGGIPELVSNVARALYNSPAHDKTRIVDVLPEPHFLDMLDKALELEALRADLVRGVAATPIFTAFASDLLYNGIRDYVTSQSEVAQRIPGASSMMKLGKSVLNRARPDLENTVEQGLRKYISRTVEATAHQSAELLIKRLDSHTLRGMALEIWQGLKTTPIGHFKREIRQLDMEEGFVLGYAYWGALRKTPYFIALLDAGIDSFFKQYGDETLTALLDDLGITEDMMIAEGMRFAPPVIKALSKKKLLDPVITRQLQDFYDSPEVAAILDA